MRMTLKEQIVKSFSLLGRRERWRGLIVFALILIASAFEALGIGLVFPLIKIVADPQIVRQNDTLRALYEGFGFSSEQTFIIAAVAAMIIVTVVKNLVAALNVYVQFDFTRRNELLASIRLFRTYLEMPYLAVARRNSAEFVANIYRSVSIVFESTVLAVIQLVSELLVVAAVLSILLAISPTSTLAVAGLFVIGVGGFYFAFSGRFSELGSRNVKMMRATLKTLQECFNGAKEIRAHGRASFFVSHFAAIQKENLNVHFSYNLLTQFPRLVLESVAVIALLAVMLFIMLQDSAVADVMALLGLYAVAAFRLMPSATKILFLLGKLRNSRAHVEKVMAGLEPYPEFAEEPVGSEAAAEVDLAGDLLIENVAFSYAPDQKPVLDGIDLVVHRGESLALVGASGAGKTTLADIVLGLLSPTEGRVTVNGHDIAANKRQWARRIGYVPQSISLTDDTLRRNIAFGYHDDEIDDQAVRRAIRLASLDEVVAKLAAGLDTVIGEDGVTFSGGQRQRIGIARALYHGPDFLVLDEATAALDNKTEREVADAIQGLAGTVTLIIIAHRLSTVSKCDRIVFLKEGRIDGIDTFSRLAAGNADFAHLVELADMNVAKVAKG